MRFLVAVLLKKRDRNALLVSDEFAVGMPHTRCHRLRGPTVVALLQRILEEDKDESRGAEEKHLGSDPTLPLAFLHPARHASGSGRFLALWAKCGNQLA